MSDDHRPSSADLRQGVFLIVLAMLILPGIDAIAKGLSSTISAGEVAWIRHVLQTIFLLPFAMRARGLKVRPHFWSHVARGVLMAAVTVVFFAALSVMPLSDAISVFFVSPLIFTVLSAVFLGAPIGWRRISAVLVGLAGSLLVVRPSYAVFGTTALLPIVAAFLFALYMLLTRKLARGSSVADAVGMQFYVGVFGAIALTPILAIGPFTGIPYLAVAMPQGIEWA
ncbi:MAG: DMT family transporter, partial [Pseudomonadota bacterium]|nr:DMT family transporter [Pseudomonadota bacterium]